MFLDFDESFDSCIIVNLSLFLSSTTPSSVRLLPIPLALSCRTSSLKFIWQMEQGLEVVSVVIAGSLRPSRGRRSNFYFSDTVLHLI